MSVQAIFGRYTPFNFTENFGWCIVTPRNQQRVNTNNIGEKSRQVSHYYVVGDLVNVENDDIARTLDLKKQELDRITEVLANGIVQFQRGSINKPINIRRLLSHFQSVDPVP